jgi:hypothetical protein
MHHVIRNYHYQLKKYQINDLTQKRHDYGGIMIPENGNVFQQVLIIALINLQFVIQVNQKHNHHEIVFHDLNLIEHQYVEK